MTTFQAIYWTLYFIGYAYILVSREELTLFEVIGYLVIVPLVVLIDIASWARSVKLKEKK